MIRVDAAGPFLSLDALRSEHARLLVLRRTTEGRSGAEAAALLARGTALGARLDTEADRAAAQALLDYWANVLDRAGADYVDASLLPFDAPSLRDSAQIAYDSWPMDEQAMARRVIETLAAPARPGAAPVRLIFIPRLRAAFDRPADTAADGECLNRALQRMLDAGWVSVRAASGDEAAQIELAQPALTRHWPPMQAWLEAVREGLDQRARLRLAAQQWERLGRPPSALRRGALLAIAQRFDDLTALEAEFVRESAAAERSEADTRATHRAREQQTAQQLSEAGAARNALEKRRAGEVRRRNLALLATLIVAAGLLLATTALAGQVAQERARAEAALEKASRTDGALREAQTQADLARSRQLTAQALRSADDDKRLFDALRAAALAPGDADAQGALFDAVHSLPSERLGTLAGHRDSVWAVAALPGDPAHVLTGGEDHTVRVWDVRTSTTVATLPGASASVYALAVSADASTLAVGLGDGDISLWSLSTATVTPTARGVISAHVGGTFGLAFNPTQPWMLMSGGADGAVRLWDTRGGQAVLLDERTRHSGWVWAVGFSPDGNLAGSVGQGRTDNTRWWRINSISRTLETVEAPGAHASTVTSLAFSPDGHSAFSGDINGLLLRWDTATFSTTAVETETLAEAGTLWGLDTQAGWLAATSSSGLVRVWSLDSAGHAPGPARVLDGHRDGSLRVAFLPRAAGDQPLVLVSGGLDRLALVWEVGATPSRTPADANTRLAGAAINGDGWLLTVERGAPWMRTGLMGSAPTLLDRVSTTARTAALARRGYPLVVGEQGGRIIVVRSATPSDTLSLDAGYGTPIDALALSEDGRQLAAAQCLPTASGACPRSQIVRFDAQTGAPLGAPTVVTGALSALAWSSNGRTLYAGGCIRTTPGACAQGVVHPLAVGNAGLVALDKPALALGTRITALATGADGRTLMVGGADGAVALATLDARGSPTVISGVIRRHTAAVLALSQVAGEYQSLDALGHGARWVLDPAALRARACALLADPALRQDACP